MTSTETRLVADWRTITKFWSARMTAFGAVLYPVLLSVPLMPPEVQAALPIKYRALIAVIYQVASLYARTVVQPKLNVPPAA